MPTHKTNDYKLTAVQYYLVEDKTQEKFVKYSNACKNNFSVKALNIKLKK